jgi:hypothetical protein
VLGGSLIFQRTIDSKWLTFSNFREPTCFNSLKISILENRLVLIFFKFQFQKIDQFQFFKKIEFVRTGWFGGFGQLEGAIL